MLKMLFQDNYLLSQFFIFTVEKDLHILYLLLQLLIFTNKLTIMFLDDRNIFFLPLPGLFTYHTIFLLDTLLPPLQLTTFILHHRQRFSIETSLLDARLPLTLLLLHHNNIY